MHAVAHVRCPVWMLGGVVGVFSFATACETMRSDAAPPDASSAVRPPPDAARPPHDGGTPDAAETGAIQDGASLCRPALARRYDPAHDCYDAIAPIPGLCFRETQPTTTTGTGEIVCLVAEDGTRYAAAMGFTESLKGDGWDTENTSGIGQGWIEKGDNGIFEQPILGVLIDGAAVTDTACAAAVSRGNWRQNALGVPQLEFASLDAGLDARAYAPECSASAADAGHDD